MARALKVVGTVVAVVAVAASAVATFGASLGLGMAAISAAAGVATVAGVAAVGVGIASSVFFPPTFTNQGNPQQFQTNPQSGLPYAIGRTRNSGLRFYAETSRTPGYNKADDLLWFGVMLSAGGAIGGIEKFTADNELITFNGSTGNGNGKYANWMAQKVWTGGLMASALALSLNGGTPPGWTSAHRLSGITHALWGLRYDAKDGAYYSAGVPQPAWIGKWVLAYDPRKDGTYPGGSGSHRALNEATYEWTRNPALHALTWALGRWQNGKRTLGIGAPLANIRVSDFIEAANIADANGWGCGGVEYSTDSKWDVLKRMLQAGGAIPTMTGAMIGCRVNKPRISIATIRSADLLDEFTGAVTKPRRDRFNTVIPRYRSEDHEWEVISGKPISVAAYVTQDGGIRQKEFDYPLVQAEVGQGYDGNKQAGQLAAYDIVNSREAGPIKWTTGPKFIGLKTGDCVTLDVPDEGYSNQPVIITSVALDPSTGKVGFTAETETNSKHAFALGTSAVPPPPFALTPPDLTPPTPAVIDWTLTPGTTSDGLPVIRMSGGVETPDWDRVIVQYRLASGGAWTSVGTYPENGGTLIEIAGVDSEKSYIVRLAYQKGNITGDWRELPAVTTTTSGLGPLSGNLLRDSIFANGEAEGWQFVNEGGMVAYGGVNGAGPDWHLPGEAALSVYQDGIGTSGYSDWLYKANVEAGNYYELSVYANLLSSSGAIYAGYIDADGHNVGGYHSENVIPNPGTGTGKYLKDYHRVYVKTKAPDGAVAMWIHLRKGPTVPGQLSSLAFWARPQIAQTTENAPSPVPYTPSGAGTRGADGAPGARGADGIPGARGADGLTLYSWYAYADSSDGAINFTTGAPGSRTWQGVAHNKTSPTESNNPSDYAWSPYSGPANFGLAASAGAEVASNKLVRTAPWSGGWDEQIYSTEGFYQGAQVRWQPLSNDDGWTGGIMVGLSTDPSSADWSTLGFAWYIEGGNGALYIAESGTMIAMGSYSPSDVFGTIYDNETVKYYQNGVLRRSVTIGPNLTLYMDSSLAESGARAAVLDFGPAAKKGEDGEKGEDGISPLLITVNPPSLALQGTATGIPMAGQLPRSVQVSAMRGGLDKAVSSISVTGTSGCSVGVSGANLTFTSVNPGGGFATINVTSDGETISGIKVPVTVGVGGTDAATSLAMSYSGAVTSATYVALGDPVAMNANASGQLRVSASSTYYATYPTIATLAIKLQVSIDGGAWTDIAGAEDIGAPTSVEPPSSTYPGAAFISPVLASALGANKPCQVRMLIRKNTAANASSSASRLLVEKT